MSLIYHSISTSPVKVVYSSSSRAYSTLSISSTLASAGNMIASLNPAPTDMITTAAVSTTGPNSIPSDGIIFAVHESPGVVADIGKVHKSSYAICGRLFLNHLILVPA